MRLPRPPVLLAAVGIAIAVAVTAGLIWLQLRGPGSVASVGGPFALVDQTGAARTDADFRGRWLLIYFGYTYCPDACPTALNDMSIALEQLGAAAGRVTPAFITIDPARDTPARLEDYVTHFHPRLVGLTGSAAAVAAVAKAYRVYFARAPGAAEAAPDYLMDHSSIIYLIDPSGRYVTHFTHNSGPEQIVAGLRKAMG